MTPLEFLAVVLPPPEFGRYCVAELTKKEHVFTAALDSTPAHIKRWHDSKLDIYFALAKKTTDKLPTLGTLNPCSSTWMATHRRRTRHKRSARF